MINQTITIPIATINQTITIPIATAKEIYELLMDSAKHSKLIGDKARVDAQEDGEFSTFSGYSIGKTTKLVKGKLIEQTWRASDWPVDHYSQIKFELRDGLVGAEIHFTQTDLPTGTENEFAQGWEDNYWEPLRKYFASQK